MPPSPFLPILLVTSCYTSIVAANDSATMAEFLTTLTPPPSGWSSSTPSCTWKGITCDSSRRVTTISLASQSLSGSLPSDLTSLTSLRLLYLQRNALSGPIPNLSSLVSLQEVNLDNNNFTSVPASVFKGLAGLQNLSISNNPNLLPWTIPADLADSPALVSLQAAGSNVFRMIPEFLGSLSSFPSLRLSYNNVSGPIPSSFNGSGIQNLWLNNQLIGMDGRIDVLASMTQLQQVWLHMNKFSGPIPDLSSCHSLFDIQLRDNDLTGIVPSTLTSLPSLVSVNLDSNKLQGPMPDNPRNIKLILGDSNSFCRDVPGPCDSQVTTLLEIAAALGYPLTLAESWTGNDACAGWTYVTCQGKDVIVITLSKQGLWGTISPAFAKLTPLKSIYLNDNDLTGSIPSSLTTLTQLQTLDVSNNNLSGSVPTFPPSVSLITSGNPLIGKILGDRSSGSGGSASGGLVAGVVVAVLVDENK
ncbi:hypothetical protein MLD38_020428 [Melastoma candidum]|uniref:Uncharacterized protein n=1 Tax=Melastoma candidum TaxID=119954 RepID=A0ACB9QD94_9MYRT|nr:hypothetical protein MLD38_020428 [Melastoma candidum]